MRLGIRHSALVIESDPKRGAAREGQVAFRVPFVCQRGEVRGHSKRMPRVGC
jgi:hypothetical protein